MSDVTSVELPNINAIRAEAIKGIAEKGPSYFNNFKMNFPTPAEKVGQFYDYRRLRGEGMNSKIGDDYKSAENRENHSQIWLEQTYEEFYKTLDKVVEETGTSLEAISQLQVKITEAHDYKLRESLNYELAEMLLPIYVRLRELGYSHYDLVI